jgi:hypothetical protein
MYKREGGTLTATRDIAPGHSVGWALRALAGWGILTTGMLVSLISGSAHKLGPREAVIERKPL